METMLWNYRDKVAYDAQPAKVVLAETAHSRTTLWCLQPGQHIHPHVHAGDHIWVVLEGTGLFLEDHDHGHGTGRPVAAGTVLVAPSGQAHGIENTGTTGLVFISVSAG
jgi:mannose-6-phosphate isomerase-like protein (cupin superfamily)